MSNKQQVAMAMSEGMEPKSTERVKRLKAKLSKKPRASGTTNIAEEAEVKEGEKKYVIKELPDDAKVQLATGQNELKNKTAYVTNTVALMKAKLKKQGVTNKQINKVITDHAFEIESAVRTEPQGLKPESGSSRETAVPLEHYMQELPMLKQISALPLRAHMTKQGNKYYDEYFVMRKCTDGTYRMTSVWFDITKVHADITKSTGRTPSDKPFTGLTACAQCCKPNTHNLMLQCKKCHSYVYCNIDCAKLHHEKHKEECRRLRDEFKKGEDEKEETKENETKQEEKYALSKNDEDYRFLNFAMPPRLNNLMKEYRDVVIDSSDLFDDATQPAFEGHLMLGLMYESQMTTQDAVAKLKEETVFSVSAGGVGTRKAKHKEPKTSDVLFAIVADNAHAVHGCVVATGGKQHGPIPAVGEEHKHKAIVLEAEVAYLKKGVGRKYVHLADEAKDIAVQMQVVPSDKLNEYFTNRLKSNEELARVFKYSLAKDDAGKVYEVKEPDTYNTLNLISVINQEFTIGKVFTISGRLKNKADSEEVQLKPRKFTIELSDDDKQPIIFLPKKATSSDIKETEASAQFEDADGLSFDEMRSEPTGMPVELSHEEGKEPTGEQTRVLSPTSHVSFN